MNEIPKNSACSTLAQLQVCYGTDIVEWCIAFRNPVASHQSSTKPSIADRLKFLTDLQDVNNKKQAQLQVSPFVSSQFSFSKRHLNQNVQSKKKEGKSKHHQKQPKSPSPGKPILVQINQRPTRVKRTQRSPRLEKGNSDSPALKKKVWHNQTDLHLTDVQLLEIYLKNDRFIPNFASPYRSEWIEHSKFEQSAQLSLDSSESDEEGWANALLLASTKMKQEQSRLLV
jgi:hypothetical protein